MESSNQIGKYAEDTLPEGQDYIHTRNNRRFEAFVEMLTDPEAAPTIGCVTGKPGSGKTIAIAKDYQSRVRNTTISHLPEIVMTKIPTNATASTVAKVILGALGENTNIRGNRHDFAEKIVRAISDNGVKLIYVDESDRLNKDSFDIIRYVHDRTGCTFIIVGLPDVLQVIDRYEQFSSRVGLRMTFKPLELEEVMDVILPNIVIKGWIYDPGNDDDRKLGTEAWKMSGSFRRLRNLLERAAVKARKDNVKIDLDLLKAAFEHTASSEEKRRKSKKNYSSGNLESESERRNDAKAGKDK